MRPAGRAAVISAPGAVVAVIGWWGFESAATPDVSRWNTAVVTAVLAAFVTSAAVGAARRPTDPRPIRLAIAAMLLTVSYFRFLHPPWLAAIGAIVWLTSPAVVVATFTEPARVDRNTSFARWNLAFAIVGLLTVAVSGPDSSGEPGDAVRALSWAWFDYRLDLMVRQPNPLVVTTSAGAVVALTIIWWVLLVALGVSLARLTNGRWWLILVRCGIGGTILLSIPVRLGRQTALLDREFGDPIIAIPLVCGAVYAAWTVWTELITPRLARPETLVVQLDEDSTVDATRRRLGRVFGDPSAQIVFPSPNGWIDEAGRPQSRRCSASG